MPFLFVLLVAPKQGKFQSSLYNRLLTDGYHYYKNEC